MSKPDPLILTGIPPGEGGAGRVIEYLVGRGARVDNLARFTEKSRKWYLLFRALFSGRNVVIFHPQTIGVKKTYYFLKIRPWRTHLFIFDSGFFCIQSYNFVNGETQPCLRCLGGHFDQIEAMDCHPFPVPSASFNPDYVVGLRRMVASGKVKPIAQNDRQARIAEKHFGCKVPVAGVWAEDWTKCFEDTANVPDSGVGSGYDVVFHANDLQPKGAGWVVEVAKHCPQLRFLMPFGRSEWSNDAPGNCEFVSMTWEDGLEDAVRKARIVLVPSLWSAPIEGALVKSIVLSQATAVVDNDSAYCRELPEGLVLSLARDSALAAEKLEQAVKDGWRPDPALKASWKADFQAENQRFYENICNIMAAK